MLQKNKLNRISLLLCILLMLFVAGCAVPQITEEWTASIEDQADLVPSTATLLLESGGSIKMPIYQADDAIWALATAGENMGYSNAMAELTSLSVQTIDGIDCYRLQQNFDGVPVYGRTLSLLADETGCALLLAGNVMDIDKQEICNQPAASTAEIEAEVAAHFHGDQTVLSASAPKLYLCATEGGWQYAFQVFAQIENAGYQEVLVDAETSQVITASETVWNLGQWLDSWGQPGAAREILNANSNTKVVSGYPVGIKKEGGVFYLEDEERSIIIGDWNGQNSKSRSSKSERVTSTDGNFDPDAVVLLYYLSLTYDYFDQNYGDRGFGTLIAHYRDGYDSGKNALGGSYEEQPVGYISMGEKTGTRTPDIIAHEYTHVIIKHLVNLEDDSESRSINEGISDIFGCIIEAYIHAVEAGNSDPEALAPDWEIRCDSAKIYRNLRDPSDSRYAEKLSDKKGILNLTPQTYYQSTLISHAAYLMWNGIDGDESAKLSTAQLANLWYLAMCVFPSDVNFIECRDLVEAAATLLTFRNYLTEEQLSCVSESFDCVEIDSNIDAQKILADLRKEVQTEPTSSAPTSMTPDELAGRLEEATEFAWNWFYINSHVDSSDCFYDPEIFGGQIPCERITEPGINTQQDVLELTETYFTEAVAEELLQLKYWIERDGALYVSGTQGVGGLGGDVLEIQVTQDSSTQYTITAWELFQGEPVPWQTEPMVFHCVYGNGNWVFDRNIHNIAVKAVDTFTHKESSAPVDQLSLGLPVTMIYVAGDGDWSTELTLHRDGTFSGSYRDCNVSSADPALEEYFHAELPNGVYSKCDFIGRFGNIRKISDAEYAMDLEEITYLHAPHVLEVVDGALVEFTEAYGLSQAKEVRLYLPGRTTADFSPGVQEKLKQSSGMSDLPAALDRWCLYNSEEGTTFIGLTADDPAEAATDCSVTFRRMISSTDHAEYAEITAYDPNGQQQWHCTTPSYPLADLTRLEEIGQFGSLYLYNESGTIVELDVYTGEVLWKNTEFGGASIAAVSDETAVYLCGYYGPCLFAVSYAGDTIKRIEAINDTYKWPSWISFSSEGILIYMDDGPKGFLEKGYLFKLDYESFQVIEEP